MYERLTQMGLSDGMSTPETRGMGYPCFCLCLVLVQMTRTIPFRRTILQFSQILRTLVRTFMTLTTLSSKRYVWGIGYYRQNSCNSQALEHSGTSAALKCRCRKVTWSKG